MSSSDSISSSGQCPPYDFKEGQPLVPGSHSVDMLAEVLRTPAARSDETAEYAPPQGELEEKLAAAWAETLMRGRIGRHDDFFALGGDSIAAVQLVMRIQEIVPEESLPLRALLEAPTVAQFAAWLRKGQGAGQQILVQMRTGSPARPPFFCVHATDGIAIGMQELATAFADDLPFYCLQAKGLDGSEPWGSVEQAAKYYLDEIRRVQPSGPYYLGGFCFGGFVAYEMASMLKQQGESVPVLAIIDGFNPAYLRGQTTVKMLVSLVTFCFRRMTMHARKMRDLGPGGWLGYAVGRLKAIFVHAGRFNERRAQVKERQNLTISNAAFDPKSFDEILKRLEPLGRALAARWTPKPYSGDAMVFRVSERSDDPYEDYYLGWRRLIDGQLESYEVEATHENILREPAVLKYAGTIDDELRRKSPPLKTLPITNSSIS
jgi:thioesterase domain-containing protein